MSRRILDDLETSNLCLRTRSLTMAAPTFRKVNCIDPCDPKGIMTRQLALLVQTHSKPPNIMTHIHKQLGWLAEPTLVNPVRMVNEITADTVIQNIHVIDPVFGNQIVQYITNVEPAVLFNTSHDRKEIEALWAKSVRVSNYTPGQARANPHFKPGEVKLDGARSDFTTSYLAKYPVTEEVPADDVAIYCNCGARGDEEDDGRAMIQCSNEARYCMKEWYHAECVGMEDDEMPSDEEDWFCDDCEEEGLGKLSDRV